MRNNRRAVLTAAVMATLFGAAAGAQAASLTWDANGPDTGTGGSGTWNTIDLRWTADAGATYQAWNSATPDDAVFSGSAGTVALGEAITAGSLVFDAADFAVDLNGNALTVGGVTAASLPTQTITNTSATLATFTTGGFASGSNGGPRLSGNLNVTFAGTSGWHLAHDGHDSPARFVSRAPG